MTPRSRGLETLIDRMIGLIDVAIRLGRAAGFKRVDVDKVLKKSLVRL